MTTTKKTKSVKKESETSTTQQPVSENNKEIALAKTQSTKALSYATNLVVVDEESYKSALEEGKRIKEMSENLTARKEEITRPLNDALKSTRELFKPIETHFNDSLATIKTKMTVYYRIRESEALKEQGRLANRVEKGTMKPETAMRKMDEIQAPSKTVQATDASATMRKVQKYRVINKGMVPLKFMEVNMVAIKNSFKAGNSVPGCEQYEETELAIS